MTAALAALTTGYRCTDVKPDRLVAQQQPRDGICPSPFPDTLLTNHQQSMRQAVLGKALLYRCPGAAEPGHVLRDISHVGASVKRVQIYDGAVVSSFSIAG